MCKIGLNNTSPGNGEECWCGDTAWDEHCSPEEFKLSYGDSRGLSEIKSFDFVLHLIFFELVSIFKSISSRDFESNRFHPPGGSRDPELTGEHRGVHALLVVGGSRG